MGAVVQAVVEPVVKAVEEVGHAVENVGREVGQAVEKVGQEVGNAAEAVGEGVATVAKTIEENPATAIAIVAVAIAAPYAIAALTAPAIGLSTTAATIIVGAGAGATVGGMSTIDTGGSVLDAMAIGAATGALGGAVAPAVSGALPDVLGQTARSAIGGAVGGAATGATTAALTGGDVGQAALAGGVGGGVGAGAGTAAGGGAVGRIVGGLAGGAAGALAGGKDSTAALTGAISGGINGLLNAAANKLVSENKPVTPGNLSEETGVDPKQTASYTDKLTVALGEALGYDVSLEDAQALARPDVNNAFQLAQTNVTIYGMTDVPYKPGTGLTVSQLEQDLNLQPGETYDVNSETGVATVYDSNNQQSRTVVLAQQAPAPVYDSSYDIEPIDIDVTAPRAPTTGVSDLALLDLIQRERYGTSAGGAGTGTAAGTGIDAGAGSVSSGQGIIGDIGYETVEPVDVEVTAPREPSVVLPELPIPDSGEGKEPVEEKTATKPSAPAPAKGAVGVSAPFRVPGGAISRPGTGSMGYYPTTGTQALAQALNVVPGVAGGGGDVDPSRTGGKKKNVWNVASLKLKDALGA